MRCIFGESTNESPYETPNETADESQKKNVKKKRIVDVYPIQYIIILKTVSK